MMHTLLITGGTGLVGQALTELLEAQGHEVRHLSTQKAQAPNRYYWNPLQGHLDADALQGVTHVIHLAGANVAKRWTAQHKAAILRSRIEGSATLEAAIAALPEASRPKALISASAVGIYPNHPDYLYTEADGKAQGFLGEVVQKWEASVDRIADLGLRVAKVRIGIVLGRGSGVLGTLLPIFRLGLGAPLGNGRHWMPWIHVEDLARQFAYLAFTESADGIWNGVGPYSVTNADFSRSLAKALHRPYFFPAVPAWVLRLAMGEMAQVGLMSTRCSAAKWEAAGFDYHYSTLEAALRNLLQPE
jgi:uncharacterized protein (TIGR01777 family)